MKVKPAAEIVSYSPELAATYGTVAYRAAVCLHHRLEVAPPSRREPAPDGALCEPCDLGVRAPRIRELFPWTKEA